MLELNLTRIKNARNIYEQKASKFEKKFTFQKNQYFEFPKKLTAHADRQIYSNHKLLIRISILAQ